VIIGFCRQCICRRTSLLMYLLDSGSGRLTPVIRHCRPSVSLQSVWGRAFPVSHADLWNDLPPDVTSSVTSLSVSRSSHSVSQDVFCSTVHSQTSSFDTLLNRLLIWTLQQFTIYQYLGHVKISTLTTTTTTKDKRVKMLLLCLDNNEARLSFNTDNVVLILRRAKGCDF